jgi:hypothetical protein
VDLEYPPPLGPPLESMFKLDLTLNAILPAMQGICAKAAAPIGRCSTLLRDE